MINEWISYAHILNVYLNQRRGQLPEQKKAVYTSKDMRKKCFKLTFESVNGRRAHRDEGKEFHILGVDELKARGPVTGRTLG